jgi:hypothetical protein
LSSILYRPLFLPKKRGPRMGRHNVCVFASHALLRRSQPCWPGSLLGLYSYAALTLAFLVATRMGAFERPSTDATSAFFYIDSLRPFAFRAHSSSKTPLEGAEGMGPPEDGPTPFFGGRTNSANVSSLGGGPSRTEYSGLHIESCA